MANSQTEAALPQHVDPTGRSPGSRGVGQSLPNVPPSQVRRPSGLWYDTALTVAGAAPG